MKKLILMLFILISSTAIAMAGSGHMKNLVETAAGNGDFKTLVAAVKAAGLVETLAGKFSKTFGQLWDANVAALAQKCCVKLTQKS